MREIKYRGWNGEQMLNVVRIHLDADGAIWWSDDFKQLKIYNAEHKPLMQFTNLKDKNGKEIYEGDVVILSDVLADGDKKICKAIMDGWQSIFESVENGFYCFMGNTAQEYREVIGNIYENSELITPLH